jgi:hypothetical protein
MRMAAAAGVGLVVAALTLGPSAAAQESAAPYAPPRSADGHPDLQGVWSASYLTRLQRPDNIKGLIIAPEDAGEAITKLTHKPSGVYDPDIDYFPSTTLASVKGTLRSSLIVEPGDGKLPYTALAKLVMKHADETYETVFDDPESRPENERCVTGLGYAPLRAISDVIPNQIVQTPSAILIVMEDTDAGRIIDMTGATPPSAVRSRAGYSSGRWDGDTLVIETTHFQSTDPIGVNFRDDIMIAQGSRAIERFSLLSDTELLYQFTVEDPALYEKPWLAEMVLKRAKGPVYEYACHEGNRGMENILTAAKVGRQNLPEPSKPKK